MIRVLAAIAVAGCGAPAHAAAPANAVAPEAARQAPMPGVPPAAREVIDELRAAAAARDFTAVRHLLEDEIVTESGAQPTPADTAVAGWRGDGSTLAAIGDAIAKGCEPIPAPPAEAIDGRGRLAPRETEPAGAVQCPREAAIPADAEQGPFVVRLRLGVDGTWRVFEALYLD